VKLIRLLPPYSFELTFLRDLNYDKLPLLVTDILREWAASLAAVGGKLKCFIDTAELAGL
jgi:hypothetical protein